MDSDSMLLVEKSVLPEVFGKVIEAKQLLHTGKASSATEAAKLAGISRSAFYKYRDTVFPYIKPESEKTLNLQAVLLDTPGILASFIAVIFNSGANILTVNQNEPVGGSALITISLNTAQMRLKANDLLLHLKSLNGVETVLYSAQ
ncbi:MAG: ACT domain-containing protein [Oscillospiraceae bacterium]|jgi:chorismate mutase|nr:ACT domain-containing protein [Oscillospiraceae bacterium]